jgi:putative redox protein
MRARAAEAEWQRVEFASRGGAKLVGCWHASGGHRLVILCHGMESSKEGDKSVALARALVEAGCDALRFDFSFVGESEGRFEDLTVSGEVDDLAGAWAFARTRVDGPIGIVGSSLGGTVALLFAAEEPGVAAVATIAAVASPGSRARALAPAERERWRRDGSYDLHGIRVGRAFLDDIERIDVAAAVAPIGCPLLLTHGTADAIVPSDDAHAIAAAAVSGAEVRLYAGVDHRFTDPQRRQEMLTGIVSWMRSRL